MNWVGGSRSRWVMRNDAQKQREFFERRKMQQKLENLGIPPPGSRSSADTGSGSMDLVTLFVVNQIAAKKASTDPPKVAVLGSGKGGSRQRRNEPLVLPMSPCSPSQLSFVESQSQYSNQGTRKRKSVIPQRFTSQQLSPVMASAFSDHSASDYLPPVPDPHSPFSSTSSASSGIFPLKLNLQPQSQSHLQPFPHYSPPPWDTSVLQQTKFLPFSQSRSMTDTSPWSCGSYQPPFQLQTPTAAQTLFGSPEPDNIEARGVTAFSLNQPEDKEPMLDFTLQQSETEQRFEDDVFRGFSYEEYEEEEASHFGRPTSKIYLTDESIRSSMPQTVPDSRCSGVELSNCTDMNLSCLGHKTGPMNGCDYSPGHLCEGGYLSSDSNDDEECCQACLQPSASYMDQACTAETINTNSGSQGNPNPSLSQPRSLTPLTSKSKINFRGDQKVTEGMVCPDKAFVSQGQLTGGGTALRLSPCPLAQAQSSELCKCKKASIETQDAGTQTAHSPAAEMCDASTQCSFVGHTENKSPGFSFRLPSSDVLEQRSATGRQTDAAAETTTLTASSEDSRSEGEQEPWRKKKSKAASLSGCNIINKFTPNNCGKVILQRPINPFVAALSKTKGRGKGSGECRDERGQRKNDPLMKDLPDEGREEVASATSANRLSENDHLQEIADILLLLNQRTKD